MQIADYSLGQNISGITGLAELSRWEYVFLRKTFPNEKILRAPDVTFLGYSWNLVLGTVDGYIYKLSAQFISSVHAIAGAVFLESFMYCSDQFGKGSVSKDGKVVKWDTSFGNVIADTGARFRRHYVNLQVTSGWLVRAAVSGSPVSASPMPKSRPVVAPVIPPPVPRQRSAKVSACIRTIESEILKRSLSDQEENGVADLCGTLLSMALGDEKIVIRLVKLEWTESSDVVDAFRRAQDRWDRDHNRFR